jgi:hypothetical protein
MCAKVAQKYEIKEERKSEKSLKSLFLSHILRIFAPSKLKL